MNYSDQGFRFAGLVYKHIVSIWESGFHISEVVLTQRNSSIKEREFQIVVGTNTLAATAGKAPKAWALNCLDFGFQYTLIRNSWSKKFGVEYWALPGSNSPWRGAPDMHNFNT